MPDVQRLQQNKERIMSIIKMKGPSFPARIARETGISPLFVSAFLAELVSEKRLKLSNTKVGSSPVYFSEGQEAELEKFIEHLNPKEREAFHILKDGQILEDEKQLPAIRVALRKIKDFAVPVTVKVDGETKLFWKFFLLSADETKERIRSQMEGSGSNPAKEEKPLKTEDLVKEEVKEEKPVEPVVAKKKEIEPILEKKPKQITESEFGKVVKEFLAKKDIEVVEEMSNKKKEFTAKIRVDALFGKQSYFLISKDKKKVTENDLTLALQKAQTEKMPALILSPGELDKKAQKYLDDWNNLVKFEKL